MRFRGNHRSPFLSQCNRFAKSFAGPIKCSHLKPEPRKPDGVAAFSRGKFYNGDLLWIVDAKRSKPAFFVAGSVQRFRESTRLVQRHNGTRRVKTPGPSGLRSWSFPYQHVPVAQRGKAVLNCGHIVFFDIGNDHTVNTRGVCRFDRRIQARFTEASYQRVRV